MKDFIHWLSNQNMLEMARGYRTSGEDVKTIVWLTIGEGLGPEAIAQKLNAEGGSIHSRSVARFLSRYGLGAPIIRTIRTMRKSRKPQYNPSDTETLKEIVWLAVGEGLKPLEITRRLFGSENFKQNNEQISEILHEFGLTEQICNAIQQQKEAQLGRSMYASTRKDNQSSLPQEGGKGPRIYQKANQSLATQPTQALATQKPKKRNQPTQITKNPVDPRSLVQRAYAYTPSNDVYTSYIDQGF